MNLPLNPLDFLKRALDLGPDRLAVIDGNERITYRELAERIYRLANLLESIGVRPGDRVAVLSPNTKQVLEGFYAVPLIGAILTPLNYRLQAADCEYILRHSGASVLLLDHELLPAIAETRSNLPDLREVLVWNIASEILRLGQDYESLLMQASAAPREASPTLDENATMTLNYTSGTTAQPKGVMLTYRNCFINAINIAYHFGLTQEDRYLWTLPMFHVNGWGCVWAVTGVGGVHVLLRKVDPESAWNLFEQHQVTIACAAPTVLIMLMNASVSRKVRLAPGVRIATGGAAPTSEIIQRMERLGIGIIHYYGLTETSPGISGCVWQRHWDAKPPAERARLKARQGVSLLGSGQIKVVDMEMREVGHDNQQVGEIVVRGNVVMAGYYNDAEATERAFRGGWFHTGDMAVVEPDGYIRIVDRSKDIIISGGENISSLEIESVLHRHPCVMEAAVVAEQHELWGEVPVAYVVLKLGQYISETSLIAYCRDELAHFKIPQAIYFVSKLPKTATGKIQKNVLRGHVREGKAAEKE